MIDDKEKLSLNNNMTNHRHDTSDEKDNIDNNNVDNTKVNNNNEKQGKKEPKKSQPSPQSGPPKVWSNPEVIVSGEVHPRQPGRGHPDPGQ